MMMTSSSGVPRSGSSFTVRRWCLIVLLGLGLLGACRKEEAAVAQSSSSSTIVVRTEEHRNAQGVLIRTESYYIDKRGKKVLHGPQIRWFDNGRKSQEIQYNNGKMHGSQIEWDYFGDGYKSLEGTWDHDQRVGTWTRWHSPDKKASECTYKAGRIVGSEQYWNYNGKLIREDSYEEGYMRESKYWNDQGKLIREDRYEEGYVREITRWYDNGQKKCHGTFLVPKGDRLQHLFESPPKDGVWTYWNDKGEVTAKGSWKEGKPWDGICGVPVAGDAGSAFGLESFGRYRDGELIEHVPDPGGR